MKRKIDSINDKILFTLYSSSRKKEPTFEDLAKKCFNDFPETFSLKKYPKLLDTRKLDRPLRTLRREGLVKGDPSTSFCLTKKGEKIAKNLTTILKQKKLL
jgi:hypothetical protein